MKKKKKKYDNIFVENCEVLEVYKRKAIIKVAEKENLIVKQIGKLKKGDKVNVYSQATVSRIEEIFVYLSPIYYVIIGIIFGLLFNNDLYHYLLILGLSFMGFMQLFGLRALIKKMPSVIYLAVDINHITGQNKQD